MNIADVEKVKSDVTERFASGDFLQRLAGRVGGTASASAVFGDPVEREGITVIPVAKAAWAFGGGSGESDEGLGSGGGGGSAISPVGYIEVRDGSAEFKPLHDPRRYALAAAAIGITAVILRARGRG